MKLLIAILLTAPVVACGPVCLPNATRCAGTLVEVCDADGIWDVAEDCAAVGDGAWQCCPVPADELGPAAHACLPADVACPVEVSP